MSERLVTCHTLLQAPVRIRIGNIAPVPTRAVGPPPHVTVRRVAILAEFAQNGAALFIGFKARAVEGTIPCGGLQVVCCVQGHLKMVSRQFPLTLTVGVPSHRGDGARSQQHPQGGTIC